MIDFHKHRDRWGVDGIPTTRYAGSEPLKWIDPDSLEAFNKNKPKGWSEDSFVYSFNSHGYRSVEFVDKLLRDDTFTVASYGCSNTFGIGVDATDTWPEIFKTEAKQSWQRDVINYNFGQGAASNDFITRIMYHSLPIIKPDLVLVLLPLIHRREMYNERGYALKLLPRHEKFEDYYINFDNEYESSNNFLKNVAFMRTMLDLHDIKYIFASCSPHEKRMIKPDDPVHILDNWRGDDMGARDCGHPSVASYTRLVSLFLEKYNQLYIDKT